MIPVEPGQALTGQAVLFGAVTVRLVFDDDLQMVVCISERY